MLRFLFTWLFVKSFVCALSLQKAYRITESGTKGKIVVATRDVKAGELVLDEKDPVLFFPEAYKELEAVGLGIAIPAFRAYMMDTSPEKQRRFMTLFGPTTGITAEKLRRGAKTGMKLRLKEGENPRVLTDNEVEIFVKVTQVTRMNIFGGDKGYSVFEEITRFAHSCDANCNWSYEGESILCHANRFVKAGEELTISYVQTRDLQPTHERRHKYLEVKEFTCHCPRCDAVGDNTRQFDCVNPACDGVMMVHQPINRKEIRITNLPYTDLQYVEPYLLPCTICHRAAPSDYQAKMLHLEAQLPGLAEVMSQRFDSIMRNPAPGAFEELLRHLRFQNIPRRHAAALPLLKLIWRAAHMIFVCAGGPPSNVRTPLSDYLACLKNLLPEPHIELSNELTFVVVVSLAETSLPSPFTPLQEKELCQSAVRMHLLLHGRENRHELLDRITARVLLKLPPAVSTEVCTYCEESPQRAAMKRSRCGQCKKTIYCSAGCQKAHWSQHKKTCVKNNIGNNTGNA